jgi:opacity protein-like surface antigen
MVKKISSAVLFCACSTVAMGAFAQPDGDNGWRLQPEFSVGGGYGYTKLKDNDFDEDEAAKKAFAQVKFNEYIGLETSYIDFDKARNSRVEFDPTGITLGLILEAPITEMFSLYAKGGQMWWDADANVDLTLVEATNNFDGNESFWGVGTKFQLTEHLDLKFEYERFNFDISRDEINVLQSRDINMDVDYASANLQFTF